MTWTCWRCGKGFDNRFPGQSVGERGPAHSYCIAAALRETEERLQEVAAAGHRLIATAVIQPDAARADWVEVDAEPYHDFYTVLTANPLVARHG